MIRFGRPKQFSYIQNSYNANHQTSSHHISAKIRTGLKLTSINHAMMGYPVYCSLSFDLCWRQPPAWNGRGKIVKQSRCFRRDQANYHAFQMAMQPTNPSNTLLNLTIPNKSVSQVLSYLRAASLFLTIDDFRLLWYPFLLFINSSSIQVFITKSVITISIQWLLDIGVDLFIDDSSTPPSELSIWCQRLPFCNLRVRDSTLAFSTQPKHSD